MITLNHDLTPCYHQSRLDGIVLSPQGRSFARGCQVNVEKQDGGEGRNKLSGRLGRGWDAREKGRGRGRVRFHFVAFHNFICSFKVHTHRTRFANATRSFVF